MGSAGKAFSAEGTAGAKALRWGSLAASGTIGKVSEA